MERETPHQVMQFENRTPTAAHTNSGLGETPGGEGRRTGILQTMEEGPMGSELGLFLCPSSERHLIPRGADPLVDTSLRSLPSLC